MAEILNVNEKRVQYNADERNLAKDGFMLNFMSVLQHLSVKIKLDKIDIHYPYHPESMIVMKDDTKLRFASQEYNEWLEELSKYLYFFVICDTIIAHFVWLFRRIEANAFGKISNIYLVFYAFI